MNGAVVPTKVYDNTPATVPTRTLPSGMAAAEKVLRRGCGAKRQLTDRLLVLLTDAGFQGVPALEYCARCLCWYLAGSDKVPIPTKLKPYESTAIRQRVRELAIGLLKDSPPFEAPLACERLSLDPYDHSPLA